MYYITFNTALISLAAGLLRFGSNEIHLYVAGIFVLGLFSSGMGIRAIRKGHEYYRRANYKKTLLEDVLGLATPLKNYSA